MSSNNGDRTGGYEVGKGKPPKEHRWAKGQSGNPRGRPKARKAEQVDIADTLNQTIVARVDGKEKKMSSLEATIRQVAKRAVGGHLPSIKQFIKLCDDYGVIAPLEPEQGGGVVFAPKGVDLHDWLEEVTELVPVDEE